MDNQNSSKPFFDIDDLADAPENKSSAKVTPNTPHNMSGTNGKENSEYTAIQSAMVIIDDNENSNTAESLHAQMKVGDYFQVHCPFPEHEDLHPSAFVNMQSGNSLFVCCLACQRKGFYPYKEMKANSIVISQINTVEVASGLGNEDKSIEAVIEDVVQEMPQIICSDPDMLEVKHYVKAIKINCVYPLAMILGKLRLHQSGYWKNFTSPSLLRHFVKACIEKCRGCELDLSKRLVDSVIDELNELYFFDSSQDTDTRINLEDSVLRISNGQFEQVEQDQQYGFIYKLPYSYDKDINTDFIRNIFLGAIEESAAVDALFEHLGSAFIPRNMIKNEEILLFLGEGSNGKSVLLDLIKATLGSDNVSTMELQDFNHDSKIQTVIGKLLNIGSELDPKKVDPARLKKLASSEPMVIDVKYAAAMTIDKLPKMIFAANKLPVSDSDTSHGYFRRFKIIPFNRRFDPTQTELNFMEKMLEHRAAVMKLIIEGAERLLTNGGFTASAKMTAAHQLFESTVDSVRGFVSDCSVEIPALDAQKKFTKAAELFALYEAYCMNEGIDSKGKREFLAGIAGLGFSKYKSGNDRGIKAVVNNPPAGRSSGVIQPPFGQGGARNVVERVDDN